MVWNITKDPSYTMALEQEWEKRMKTLRFRTEHLGGLARLPDDKLISEFSRAAPYWADQRTSIKRVEAFIFELQAKGRLLAHAGCMQAWGEAVHKKPSSFHAFFKVENFPQFVDRSGNVATNRSFRANDSFEALNTYLAIDPLGCLEQSGLLSKNWVRGLAEADKRDAAIVAILSAFYRYGDQKDNHLPQGAYSQGRVAHATSLLHRISESAGISFVDIVKSMAPVKKAAPAVNRFYGELVDYRMGTAGASIPTAISSLHSIMVAGGLFELAMHAKLFSTFAHSKVMSKGFKRDADESYYSWVIDSEFTALSEIKAIFEPEKLTAEHLASMHEKGLAVPYLKSLDEDTLVDVIGKGIVLPKYLSRASDRGKLLEIDLGM